MRFSLLASFIFAILSAPALAWSTLPARHQDDPSFRFTPSPTDWRGINIYQIITDRFADGDPSNNHVHPDERAVNIASPWTIHGGDFEGMRQKLDYLEMLGVRAVWISPIVYNVGGEYHGYAAQDFNRIDPHWGTLAELRRFIDEAHARGIYVFIDIVTNHMGDLIHSKHRRFPQFRRRPYRLAWKDERRHAKPFDDLRYFYGHGSIANWNKREEALLGDFSGLDSLRTEDEEVRQHLIRIHEAMIAATDCDGFRIDTAKHVEMSFWDEFLPAIHDYAARLGKTNFLTFAEALVGDDHEAAPYTHEDRFRSVLYFPMHWTLRDVFAMGHPTAELTRRLSGLKAYKPASRFQLVNFLDSHDETRFLSEERLDGDHDRLKTALTFLYTAPQIPCLYYGTEQGFDGGHDPANRADMFDGAYEDASSKGDNFNYTHELFQFVRRLNLIRSRYPALLYGGFQERWQTTNGPGLYIFSRKGAGDEVVIALNTSDHTLEAFENGLGPATGYTNGTVLLDAFDPDYTLTVGSGGMPQRIRCSVPPNSYRVLVPAASWSPLPPSIIACTPHHDARTVSVTNAIMLQFDQPMDTSSVEHALSISPPTPVRVTWDSEATSCTITPHTTWVSNQTTTLSLTRQAISLAGFSMGATFLRSFETGDSARHFVMDGHLDAGATLLASNHVLAIYMDFNKERGELYVATTQSDPDHDLFVFMGNEISAAPTTNTLWHKPGRLAVSGPFLAAESESAYCAWFRAKGRASAVRLPETGFMEGTIRLGDIFGRVPEAVYLAVARYATEDGGGLDAATQLPAAVVKDGHLGPDEFLRVPLLP